MGHKLLEVETRGPFEGPRAHDAGGPTFHFDNPSLFKERFIHAAIWMRDRARASSRCSDDALCRAGSGKERLHQCREHMHLRKDMTALRSFTPASSEAHQLAAHSTRAPTELLTTAKDRLVSEASVRATEATNRAYWTMELSVASFILMTTVGVIAFLLAVQRVSLLPWRG